MKFKYKCSELKLKQITRADLMVPNKNLLTLKKKKNIDLDKLLLLTNLNDSTEVSY